MRDHVITPYVGLIVVPTHGYANRHGCTLKAGVQYTVQGFQGNSVVAMSPSRHLHTITRSDLHRSNFRTVDPSEATHDPPLEAVDR